MQNKQKEVTIIAGANGSGKTVFAKEYIKSTGLTFLNADEIALQLSPKNIKAVRLKAGKIFLKTAHELIDSGTSFILETTLSGKYLEKICTELKKNNYFITTIFIFLESPDACINRVRERVLKGGHDVPKKDIIRRYYRGIDNFWKKYRYLSNKWYIIENSYDGFQEIATGSNNSVTISDEKLYKKFLEILKKNRS